MTPTYPVERITYPWLGGVGFLAGLPAVLVELCEGAPGRTADQIVEGVNRKRRPLKARAPKWVAIIGRTVLADNDLALAIRVHVQCPVYIETDGTAPMCGLKDGRLPMWEHVAVRAELPIDRIQTERFHSVVVKCPPENAEARMDEFSRHLLQLGYNGPRYVEGRGAPSVVAAVGLDWRVTAPMVRAAADGSWLFEADA